VRKRLLCAGYLGYPFQKTENDVKKKKHQKALKLGVVELKF
jgi:hypothetical protein